MRIREALMAAALAACSGILLAAAFPPYGLWPLAPLAAVPLAAIALRRDASGARMPVGWLALVAVFVVCTLKWYAMHYWLEQVTPAGTVALSVYCALYDTLAVWTLSRLRCGAGRLLRRRVPRALLVPLAFAAVEALRAMVIFHGYPWFRWGHPLIEAPVLVQGADLLGELFASLLALVVAGGILDAVGGVRRVGPAIAVVAVAAAAGYGAWRLQQAPTAPGPGVLAIQTNLETSNKVAWKASNQVRDIPSFADLTLRAAQETVAGGHAIALAAWPETMLAGYGLEPSTIALQEAGGYFPGDRFLRIAVALHQRLQAPLLVGSPAFLGLREEGQRFTWERQYNSAYLIDRPNGPFARYDKVFLAPFGETMPYISEWKWLEQSLLAFGAAGMTFDLDVGGLPTRFAVPWQGGTVRVATPICFEDAMTWVCRELVFPAGDDGTRTRATDLLVNLTNDGWYGWYDGGRQQHLQIARFRCIETRTPMVRVANTGLCAGIDSSGRVVAPPIAPREAGWLYAAPSLDARTPIFALVGEVASIIVMTIAGILAIVPNRSPARNKAARSGGVAGAGSAARAVARCSLLAGAAWGIVVSGGCDDNQTVADQPWSSRDQSIQPSGQAKLSDEGRVVAEQLPVTSSGNAKAAAVELLQSATRSKVPVFRANACEALISSPPDLHAVVVPLLSDENRGVRFVAATSIGRASLGDLADHVQPLLLDESPSVRAAAMYTLTKLGRQIDLSPLAAMVRSDDPEIRSNAYMVLGEIGNKSAVGLIRDSLGKGMRQVNPARVRICELQASEALVRLGQADGIEPIRAALFAPGEQSEFTALAAQQAGRLKDDGSRAILMRLIDASGVSARPTEVRIVCAAALAQISTVDAPQIIKIARVYIQDREPDVRGQAALAYAWAGGPAAVPDLQRLLFDQDPSVQLAAAKAILIATRRH